MYELLQTIPPINKWNLPASEDVEFRVETKPLNQDRVMGYYQHCKACPQKHIIVASKRFVKTINGLTSVMAHEMIHMFHQTTHMQGAHHGRAFTAHANQLEQVLGIDIE